MLALTMESARSSVSTMGLSLRPGMKRSTLMVFWAVAAAARRPRKGSGEKISMV